MRTVLLALALIAGAPTPPGAPAPIDPDKVAILPLDALSPRGGLDPYWAPTRVQTDEALTSLADYVNTRPGRVRPLSAYRFQAHGVTVAAGNKWPDLGGEAARAIEVSAFCSGASEVLTRGWRERQIIVMDGGNCYFRAFYDPDRKKILWLSVNGVA